MPLTYAACSCKFCTFVFLSGYSDDDRDDPDYHPFSDSDSIIPDSLSESIDDSADDSVDEQPVKLRKWLSSNSDRSMSPAYPVPSRKPTKHAGNDNGELKQASKKNCVGAAINSESQDIPLSVQKSACSIASMDDGVSANDKQAPNIVTETSVTKSSRLKCGGSDRPARPCMFCGIFKVRLTRHIRRKHRNEERVKHSLVQNTKHQRSIFKQLKKDGIMKHNMKIAGLKGATILRERLTKHKNEDGVCDTCSGVFSRRWFSSHKRTCFEEHSTEPQPVATSAYFGSFDTSDDFKKEILTKFANDEVGKLCQEEETIVMIGSKLYRKLAARKDKKVEVRRSVMADMRRLGHVYCHFRAAAAKSNSPMSSAFRDMFKRENFNTLEEACLKYTTTEAGEKSGLQIAIYYLLIRSAKIIKVFHLIKNDNVQAEQTGQFLDVLHFSKDSFIGGAMYNTNKHRNTNLRRVDNLPNVEDVTKLKNHMVTRIKHILDDKFLHWSSAEYVELRDMVCARLTLFNARRGGEPARLQLSHWTDACNRVWFNKTRIAAMPIKDQEYFNDAFVMFQTGKGVNHLVPVLVPEDSVPGLKKLVDPAIRLQCGVSKENNYLFPSTTSSDINASGWHALNRACIAAGIESSKITATKMRHYTSTLYASLEVPEAKRAAFYAHMGHSKAVNQSIYQAPLAEQEVLDVGSVLRQFGKIHFALGVLLFVMHLLLIH